MIAAIGNRLGIGWLLLSAITLVSLWISTFNDTDTLRPNAAITCSVLAIALIKARVIMREFMEVRHAPVLLCRLTDIWLLLTAVSLIGTYLVGMRISTI